MTTRAWTQQSGNAGVGDWFSNDWIVSGQFTGPPAAGDTADLFTGTVSITTADAISTPTLDGIAIAFVWLSGAVPTLDVSNEQFGSGITIANGNSGFGVLVARGVTGFAGTLSGAVAAGALTLDIEAISGVASFSSTGTVQATNGGALVVTGTADAVLTNAGLLTANDAGTLTVGTALTSDGGATLDALLEGVLQLNGPVTNAGTLFASELIGSLYSAGTVDISGLLTNSGTITNPYFGVIAATGGVVNRGTIGNAGGAMTLGGDVTNDAVIAITAGTLDFTGAVANSGTIGDNGGVLDFAGALANSGTIGDGAGNVTVTGSLSGSGTIDVADHVTLDGPVAAGQVIDFGTATDATLALGDIAQFSGTIAGLSGHDIIDINGTATGSSYNSATGVLSVLDGSATLDAFTLEAGTTLNATPDGNGGTVLTTETIGTPAQVENYIVQNDFAVVLPPPDNVPETHGWPTPDATVYYTFEAGNTFTAADTLAFLQAMTLYSDIANITFDPAGGGHAADLFFTTASDGQADTSYSIVNDAGTYVASSATVAIDTTVAGWTDLSGLGVNDSSGYGGYGFLTVLHEMGHVIGFGHSGPYNDGGVTANFLADQIFYTDTRQYSVMSYIDAAQSGADWQSGTTAIVPQTPMLYDIGAAQQIYGANTLTLHGGDTFGFNSTFGAGSAHPIAAYDFTQNTVPVVTLYDGGPNNTLDLSGFSSASYVNLNSGAFSNADGLTDNIAIAYNTTIDSAIGGSGNNTFVVNPFSDTIDGGSGGANTVVFAAPQADYTVAGSGGTITVTDMLNHVADTLTNVQVLDFAGAASLAPCFVSGTRIRTVRGEVPVEALRAGEDRVLTRDGRAAPVVWLGWRRTDPAKHPRPADVLPVRVRAGAIAPGQPARDLLLSPDHALALDGVLIPVRYLLNGATVVQEAWGGELTYWHVELDRHDVLFAEGAPAESYLDTGNRAAFANGGRLTHLHAAFGHSTTAALAVWQQHACAPLVAAGPRLTALRDRLAARAGALGYRVTTAPDLRATVDGQTLKLRRRGDAYAAAVPAGSACVRLLSRAWVPLHMDAAGGDARRLGVAIAALRLDGCAVPLDDARLGAGWHAPEMHWRWTDGAASIATGGARRLDLRVVTTGRYWLAPLSPDIRSRRVRR